MSMSGDEHEGVGGEKNPSDEDQRGKDLCIGFGPMEGQGGGGVIRKGQGSFFVAVHVGAGFHSEKKAKAYQLAMRRACQAAAAVLSGETVSCLDAVAAAIRVLEDDEVTNAGRGSNLTEDGHVECDASVMDGHSGAFGAVGAVPGVRNAIDVAMQLAKESLSLWVMERGSGQLDMALQMNQSVAKSRMCFKRWHCYESEQLMRGLAAYRCSALATTLQEGPGHACETTLRSVIEKGHAFGGKDDAGVLFLQSNCDSTQTVELVAVFSSSSFGIGYYGSSMNKPKTKILRRLPRDDSVSVFAQNFKIHTPATRISISSLL
ncbi:putative threonine aspartase isoform X2 [Physcomitrium patens]|uniref:putative threonine aspartase isoform X2 n=1 Tax=Physcomitrium patens TaxID=3218 RepID=UPI003CCDFA40